jgi:hypothetical protein
VAASTTLADYSIGDPHPNGGKTCAGLAGAGYTVAMRHARLDGLHAAAIAVISVGVYLLSGGPLLWAPVRDGMEQQYSCFYLAVKRNF